MSTPVATRTSGLGRLVLPVLAFSIIYTLLYLIPNLLPIFTGVVIDVAGFSAAKAGWVATTFLGSMSVAALGSAYLLKWLSMRVVAIIGLVIQVVGYLLPFAFDGGGAVVFAMGVAGFGIGALFAVANASAAQLSRPVLIYGAGIALSNVASAFMPDPFYDAVEKFGVPGMFIIPLLIVPLVVLSLGVISNKTVEQVESELSTSAAETAKARLSGPALALLIAICLTNVFNFAYYNFADRLLVAGGFDYEAIADIFQIIFFAAAIFGVIAAVMSVIPRFLTVGLLIGTALLTLVIVLAIAADGQTLLQVNAIAQGGLSMLVISLQLAVAAQIDPTGRVAAIASAVLFASWTAGPSLGGEILEAAGFDGISNLSLAMGVVSVGLLIYVHLKTRVADVVAPEREMV